ncbi:MAG: disulfide bond formation protein B [Pseudomonadota bacterium]|nr:disulfide bond formation protein B [Pseudomonadota bacterium]
MSINPRYTNLLGFLGCAGLLAFAYYLQYGQGLDPCPLCIIQRVAFLALGLVFLAAALHNPKGFGRHVYTALLVLTAVAGIALAIRHLWLQSLPPDRVPACGPDLAFMLRNFPLQETINTVLRGSGSCANVDWRFLGLTIPGWALVWFLVLGGGGVVTNEWLGRRTRQSQT